MNKRVQTSTISTDNPSIRGLVITWIGHYVESIVTIDTLIYPQEKEIR